MADSKHVKILKRGVEAWNKWRQAKPYISPNLSDTNLSGMDLRTINFSNTNLSHSKLKGTNFGIDNSRRTGPRWAIVPALTYSDLDENRANFTNAVLQYSDLEGANFEGVDLRKADLAHAHLSTACFKNADLDRARLSESEAFDKTDFSCANLDGVNFFASMLNRIVLNDAHIMGAKIFHAKFCDVDLRKADLRDTIFCASDFKGTDFDSAWFGDSIFWRMNLGNVKNLEKCKHYHSSVIDHTTFALSGQLPIPFLRGCGLPERVIDTLPSLVRWRSTSTL